MKKNLINKGIEALKDIAVYDAAVKEAQNKFWDKHPVYKKIVAATAAALVVANVAMELDEAGAFDGVKQKVKEVKKKKTIPTTSNTK